MINKTKKKKLKMRMHHKIKNKSKKKRKNLNRIKKVQKKINNLEIIYLKWCKLMKYKKICKMMMKEYM